MFTQKKVLQPGICEKADLIDDIPEYETYRAPFTAPDIAPDGYMGISAFWEVVDADEKPIAHFFCRDAACEMVRVLNSRAAIKTNDPGPVVIQFTR